MRSIFAPAFAAMLTLSGCGGGESEPKAQTKSITASSPYVEKLKGLSALNRGLALRRAIIDSGQTCKKVESSGYQEDYKNMSVWVARCSERRDWMLFIAPNGDVQVRGCRFVEELGLPPCKLDAQPKTS